MRTVLSIAGSDCSGGAGIQADLKTFTVHKLYGMSVITALTAQNTTGVSGIYEVAPEFVSQQLDMVFSDIFPEAIKIGMVADTSVIEVIAAKLVEYRAKNIVLDPVMISTSGSKLLKEEAVRALVHHLIPLADIITPNIPEAEVLSGVSIRKSEDMEHAAKRIAASYSGNILIKGGHLKERSDDLLYIGGRFQWFRQENIDNPNTHGTGCTLSSAIACNLALGRSVIDSIAAAKEYITGALETDLDLGKGRGPLNHCWNLSL